MIVDLIHTGSLCVMMIPECDKRGEKLTERHTLWRVHSNDMYDHRKVPSLLNLKWGAGIWWDLDESVDEPR